MGMTEKVAVTLPKDDVRRLRQVESARKIPFSAVIREAVETWLRIQDEQTLKERYQRYYADPKVRAQEEAWTRQMVRSSSQQWPLD